MLVSDVWKSAYLTDASLMQGGDVDPPDLSVLRHAARPD
jgi:hypothetical protein